MVRPKKPEEDRRHKRTISASDQEWRELQAAAKAVGTTRGRLIREAALAVAKRVTGAPNVPIGELDSDPHWSPIK